MVLGEFSYIIYIMLKKEHNQNLNYFLIVI